MSYCAPGWNRPGRFDYHPPMLFRRYGKFVGGIDLPDEKYATLDRTIEPYQPAGTLRVPLGVSPVGASAEAIVEPGQAVTAGQRIGAARDGGIDVFSPMAGKVVAFSAAEVAGGDEFFPSQAVEIDVDGQSFEMPQTPPAVFDWRAASAATLRQRIADGSITTYRRPVISLAAWMDRARSRHCRTIVANVMESQPMVTAAHRALVEHGAEVIRGLAILRQAMEASEAILAVDHRRTTEYQQIVAPARTHRIDRIALPHKYPTGMDEMLLKVLARREAPPGHSTLSVGFAVIDAATCLAVYRWVACGLPPLGRVVTLDGARAGRVGNFWVPFGTLCMELVAQQEQPVIQNGPMVGVRCKPLAVVTPATDAVLALEATVPAPPGPCIRCCWCTDHCPARLNVSALNDAYELGQLDRARQLVAPACVECGVCTYVCPARLPLSQRVKQLKRALQGARGAMSMVTQR